MTIIIRRYGKTYPSLLWLGDSHSHLTERGGILCIWHRKPLDEEDSEL